MYGAVPTRLTQATSVEAIGERARLTMLRRPAASGPLHPFATSSTQHLLRLNDRPPRCRDVNHNRCCTGAKSARTPRPRARRTKVMHSKTVSLVLGGSGGGPWPGPHWGHSVVDRQRYNIRSIAGSSMGALVGGIYAASKLEVYASGCWRWSACRCCACSIRHSVAPGLFKGERIIRRTCVSLIGDFAIEDLPVSFTRSATDLGSGEEVLGCARASCSTRFAPRSRPL